ncbi:MAG: endoglucanase [Actinomycetota bacterium]|nr:endoglucanase [Actinomycetota bacterium]
MLALAASAALLLVVTPQPSQAPERVAWSSPLAPSPFAGARLYVDPATAATRDPVLSRVTGRAQASWFGDWVPTGRLTAAVSDLVGRAAAAGALPVLVAYDIPLRDCGSYSLGGASSSRAYRDWISAFAAGIGPQRAVVVLEPDALAQIDCLSAADRAARYDLLRYAVRVLDRLPAVATYLDAGHSSWVPTAEMAARLVRAGVVATRGFALNVSNFQWTTDELRYGRSLSSLLGWKRFVVDTSRNGLGPALGPDGWCNPSGRALGAPPLTPVNDRLVDALLWVKRPGESDGSCGRGDPPAGVSWAAYARGLAQRSLW